MMKKEPLSPSFFSADALRSVPWLLIGKIFSFAIYFLASVVIVRSLSPAHYGAFSLIKSMAEYLIVFCGLGLNFALLRYLPELNAGKHFFALKKLIHRSVVIQGISLAVFCLLILVFYPIGTQIFSIDFSIYAPLLAGLIVIFLAKEFFAQVLTALYLTRVLSILSVFQGLLLLLGLIMWTQFAPLSAFDALSLYGFALAIGVFAAIFALRNYLKNLKQGSEGGDISSGRVAYLSLPAMVRSLLNKLLEQYSEIFFLGYLQSATMVGFYVLGTTIPQLVITFIPLTLHSLFTSAFAETYTKDRKSLPHLIEGMYQILILICLPLSFFGAVFSPALITWIYGEKMALAGPVASFFFLFKLFPLVWIPLAMAVTAKEKLLQTLWIDLLPVLINLPLDYFLIKSYGINGAMAAVAIAFLITLPLKLWYLRRLIGPFIFPFSFFFRIGGLALALAIVMGFVFSFVQSYGLFFLAVGYAILFFVSIRLFRIITETDVNHFRKVGVKPINQALDFLVARRAS